MIEKSVCNLKFIMFIRQLLGFRQDSSSRKLRIIIKLYSMFFIIALLVTTLMRFQNIIKHHLILELCLKLIEFIFYLGVTFHSKDKYIYKYYKRLHYIDNLPGAERLYKKFNCFLNVYFFYMVFNKIALDLAYCKFFGHLCYKHLIYTEIVCEAVMGICIDMGRFTLALIFGLLYYRTKLLVSALENMKFDKMQNKRTMATYVRMYEALVDSLKSVDYPVKQMVIVTVITSIVRFVVETTYRLNKLKYNGPDYFGLLILLLHVVRPIIFLIVPTFALDLTTDNIKKLRVLSIEKRILCENERHRKELHNLMVFLQHYPLRCTVWRAFSLSLYILLSCYSFCIVNIIAILQIKRYFS